MPKAAAPPAAKKKSPRALEPSKALFIRRWGEMSSYWGINRTMAEIHALLYVSTEPICTDDVMELLQVSRGNASMNLRSIVDWGLAERLHRRGDRKEYFLARTDVWEMFETIMRQRNRREVEPIVETIEHCRHMAATEFSGRAADSAAPYLQRLETMHAFLKVLGTTVDMLLKLGPRQVDRLTAMLAKIAT